MQDRLDMESAARETSRQRFWTGFVATICETGVGNYETLNADTNVTMHVGVAAPVTTRCDGATVHRLAVPGDLKIFPPGYSRALEIECPTTHLLLNLAPSLMSTAAEDMGVDAERTSIELHLHLRDPQLEHIGWAVKAELETDAPLGRLYSDSLGLALAAHLLRRYARASAPRRVVGGLSKRRLQRVKEYINQHLSDDLTLAELAEVASVSPSHFKALFKQSVGLPVHQYVVRCRVEYAMERLLMDDLPLSDLALQAGFANASHLARWMRRIAGITPGVLKRNAD